MDLIRTFFISLYHAQSSSFIPPWLTSHELIDAIKGSEGQCSLMVNAEGLVFMWKIY